MTDPISRYFAFTKRSIKGPFYPKDLAQLPGFGRNTLVCREAALGQWKEAYLESDFQTFLEPAGQARPKPPLTHETADDRAVRSLLEKAIRKNSQLDNDVREMKRDYGQAKRRFEDELKKKDQEIKTLAEKLKRNAAAQIALNEHPSWEHLYKTLKKRADEKICEATQGLAEKSEENLRLRNQMQNMVDTYEDSKRALLEKGAKAQAETDEKLKELSSELEEKELIIKTMSDSMQSVLGKSEDFQHIMLDERRDYEEQNARFCEEIGKLRGEVKWKQQELDRLKADLFDALNKIHEFESAGDMKTREQEELYGVIHAKVKILTGYFENLESRLKYAFKKT
jgi:chromosome segregation ATPase